MQCLVKQVIFCSILLCCDAAYSFATLPGHLVVEAGSYTTTIGKSQHVSMQGLIGDDFSASHRHDGSPVFGFGYLAPVFQGERLLIDVGLNVYYLAKTNVSGLIRQEGVYTNLGYTYYVSHLPVYAVTKASLKTSSNDYLISLIIGIGPNFMSAGSYDDYSIAGSTVVPDHAFTNHTVTVMSAMAGLGFKLNQTGRFPFEIGYRLYYLGEGYLKPDNGEVLSNLYTGNIFANALVLTLSI